MGEGGYADGQQPVAGRGPRRARPLAAVAAATTVLVAMGALPATAQYEEPAEIAVSSSSVDCGDTIEVSGRHWMPASGVDLTLDPVSPNAPSRSLADDVTVGADGTFAVAVTIPEDAHPGANDVVATGTDAGGAAASAHARVVIRGRECAHGGPQSSTSTTTSSTTAAPSTTALPAPTTGRAGGAGGGNLPFTGSGSTRELVLFVAGLIVVGSGLTAVARRRRRLA